MDKKQRKANQKLQQAKLIASNTKAKQPAPMKKVSSLAKEPLHFCILTENIYFGSQFMRKGTLVSYRNIRYDECVFTDSNNNIIIGRSWQAKTVMFGKSLKFSNHD